MNHIADNYSGRLEKRRVQLPKGDVYYDALFLKKGFCKLDEIPEGYLIRRLEYAIRIIRAKIKASTRNHHQKHRNEHLTAAMNLKGELSALISQVEGECIISREQLADFCKKVKSKVKDFKAATGGDVTDMIRSVAQAAELFFQEEQEAVKRLFNLPSMKVGGSGKRRRVISKGGDAQSHESPKIRQLLSRVRDNPDLYLRFERMARSKDGQIAAINELLEPIVEAHDDLTTFLSKPDEKKKLFRSLILRLEKDRAEAFDLIGDVIKFDSPEALNAVNDKVRIAVAESYEKYLNTLWELTLLAQAHRNTLNQIKMLSLQTDSFEIAFEMGLRSPVDLNSGIEDHPAFMRFYDLLDKWEEVKLNARETLKEISQFYETLSPVISIDAGSTKTELILELMKNKRMIETRNGLVGYSELGKAEGLEGFFEE